MITSIDGAVTGEETVTESRLALGSTAGAEYDAIRQFVLSPALVDRTTLETWLPPDDMAGRFERFDPTLWVSLRLSRTWPVSSSRSCLGRGPDHIGAECKARISTPPNRNPDHPGSARPIGRTRPERAPCDGRMACRVSFVGGHASTVVSQLSRATVASISTSWSPYPRSCTPTRVAGGTSLTNH